MKDWLKLIFGAAAMGVIWAAVWAATGALIEILDPNATLDSMWLGPPIGVLPGFVGGVVFSVLWIAARATLGSDELSLLVAAACGGMVGMLLGVLPLAINQPPAGSPMWLVAAVVIGAMTLMSTVSATGTAVLVRAVRARSVPAAGRNAMSQRRHP